MIINIQNICIIVIFTTYIIRKALTLTVAGSEPDDGGW